MNEAEIVAAVDRLNEQLKTPPDWLGCAIEDLYPDFEVPECGPEMYLALLEDEARQVKAKIEQAAEAPTEDLQRLLVMLVECALSLRLAGVTTLFEDDMEETVQSPLAGEAGIGNDPHEPPAGSNGHQQDW